MESFESEFQRLDGIRKLRFFCEVFLSTPSWNPSSITKATALRGVPWTKLDLLWRSLSGAVFVVEPDPCTYRREPQNAKMEGTQEEDSWKQSFPPGISTAFLIVDGAVSGLLGHRHHAKKQPPPRNHFSPYKIASDTDGVLTISLSPVVTPRPLDLKRLREESALLSTTLQTIVDRTVADGLEIQLYQDPRTIRADTAMQPGEVLSPHIVIAFVQEYVTRKTTSKRAFYTRTNALASITLDQVRVDEESSTVTIAFKLLESPLEKRLAEPMQASDEEFRPILDKIRLMCQPRIQCFEGHAFYDRLQLKWWRLPMVHFWICLAILYCLFTVPLVAMEMFAPGEKQGFRDHLGLSLDVPCVLTAVVTSGIVWALLSYFQRTGVLERLHVGTLHLRGKLDSDSARVAQLASVCFVPFVEPAGTKLVGDLQALSGKDVSTMIVFVAKCSLSLGCLLCYPILCGISAVVIGNIFSSSLWAILVMASSWSEAADESPRERRRRLHELSRRIGVLLLTVCVYLWYYHLANSEHNFSAMLAAHWLKFILFGEFGPIACAVVLGTAAGIIFALFLVVYSVLQEVHRRLRNRLPRWRL